MKAEILTTELPERIPQQQDLRGLTVAPCRLFFFFPLSVFLGFSSFTDNLKISISFFIDTLIVFVFSVSSISVLYVILIIYILFVHVGFILPFLFKF